jgi:hypothetical protein
MHTRLTGDIYIDVLVNVPPAHLEGSRLHTRRQLYHVLDVVPAHFCIPAENGEVVNQDNFEHLDKTWKI